MTLRNLVIGIVASAALVAMLTGPTRARTLADLVQEVRGRDNGLFGSIEFSSGAFRVLPQWDRVIDRMGDPEWASASRGDRANRCAHPAFQAWCRFLAKAAALGRMDRLDAVNRFFNRLPYRADRETYGRTEYWATPREFMTRSGDCEDYSIAKYFALRELGFGKDEMRIVILMDAIRGIGHAVLAIYVGNDILILDNRSNLIVSHSRYKHYVPQYSMNETTRWVHVQGTA